MVIVAPGCNLFRLGAGGDEPSRAHNKGAGRIGGVEAEVNYVLLSLLPVIHRMSNEYKVQ